MITGAFAGAKNAGAVQIGKYWGSSKRGDEYERIGIRDIPVK